MERKERHFRDSDYANFECLPWVWYCASHFIIWYKELETSLEQGGREKMIVRFAVWMTEKMVVLILETKWLGRRVALSTLACGRNEAQMIGGLGE